MRLRLKRVIKQTLLSIRKIFFHFLSVFPFFSKKKIPENNKLNNVLVISQKRVGDTVVSIPAFRAIKESLPRSRVTVFSNSYVREIFERVEEIDNITTYDKRASFLKKAKLVRKLSQNRFDLAVDLTCDYTYEGALLAYLSRAKYRVGYDTYGRGFLFNKRVKHEKQPIHAVDEILNIVQSINLDTKDKNLKISASEDAADTISQFLKEGDVKEEDLLIAIHPGGYYPTQRWLNVRFAEVADEVIKKYRARVILIGGPKEKELLHRITENMSHKPLIFLNQPVRNLLALIQSCQLLFCNNSGPLHLATALRTPTVSVMGPTIPERWWPFGQGHVVIRKDLDCMPCNEGYCRLKTLDCMKLIAVDEVMKAIEVQIYEIKGIEK